MVVDPSPRELSWVEVDPGRHPFDAASAADVVKELGPGRDVPTRPADSPFHTTVEIWLTQVARPWADAMSHALAEHYGRWALGWRWARAEGDIDGGPITSWCCASHSMSDPETTLATVAAALCEWRDWLEQLAAWFETSPRAPGTVEDQRDRWHRTARRLVLRVVERTEYGSAWYDHCDRVLTWFLERWGISPAVAQDLVGAAIGGRFRSWTAPDPELVDDVAARLAPALPPAAGPLAGAAPDHLARWLAVRDEVPWNRQRLTAIPPRRHAARDGVADHIRAFDAAIDPDRARGLLAALELVRVDARRGAPLDPALLRRWQHHVLGFPGPAFRTRPAFAKGGRERYGLAADTFDRFAACLAESADQEGSLPLVARAARAYLDVCYFHPFDDGNARSALLTLVFVLAREGVTPGDVGPLRRLSFDADDPDDALACARIVEVLIAAI